MELPWAELTGKRLEVRKVLKRGGMMGMHLVGKLAAMMGHSMVDLMAALMVMH
jgi:hypothetical protein